MNLFHIIRKLVDPGRGMAIKPKTQIVKSDSCLLYDS